MQRKESTHSPDYSYPNTPSFTRHLDEHPLRHRSLMALSDIGKVNFYQRNKSQFSNKRFFSFGEIDEQAIREADEDKDNSFDSLLGEEDGKKDYDKAFCLKCACMTRVNHISVKVVNEDAQFWLIFGILFFPFLPIGVLIYCFYGKEWRKDMICYRCEGNLDLLETV